MDVVKTKVLVLGGGPAGYVCAIRAGQLGLETVLVDSGKLGGTCLNVGCIPSKALIHSAQVFSQTLALSEQNKLGIETQAPRIDLAQTVRWKNSLVAKLNSGVAGLLKKANVSVLSGTGVLEDGKSCVVRQQSGEIMVKSEHTVIATGSEPISLPGLGFGNRILSSSDALALTAVPNSMVVVGGGYIGLELGGAFARMGTRLTIVEASERLLPHYDEQLTDPVVKHFDALGSTVMTDAKVISGQSTDDGVALKVHQESTGETADIEADYALVTVGRKALLDGWGLDALELDVERGYVAIDESGLTSMTDVWAIGDVTGEPMLAHRAMAQGEMVADNIGGAKRIFDHVSIPEICFTQPEVVQVGRPYSIADEQDDAVIVRSFPFAANGRSMTMQESDGFVRVIAASDTKLVLGLQAVGGEVSELSAAFSLALEMGATLEDIAGTIHAHPTRSEAFQESALMALQRPLHL